MSTPDFPGIRTLYQYLVLITEKQSELAEAARFQSCAQLSETVLDPVSITATRLCDEAGNRGLEARGDTARPASDNTGLTEPVALQQWVA